MGDLQFAFVVRILRLIAGLLCDMAAEWCQQNPRCKALYDRAARIISELNDHDDKQGGV